MTEPFSRALENSSDYERLKAFRKFSHGFKRLRNIHRNEKIESMNINDMSTVIKSSVLQNSYSRTFYGGELYN